MADLYSRLSTYLLRTETESRTQAPVTPPSVNLSLLTEQACEPYFSQLRSEVAAYLQDPRPALSKQRFYKALYTALLMVCEADDPKLRAKLLVKTYAWQLANKPKADRCSHCVRKPPQARPDSPSPRPMLRSEINHTPTPLTERLSQHRREQMQALRNLVRRKTGPVGSGIESHWPLSKPEETYRWAVPRRAPTLVECRPQGWSVSPEKQSFLQQLTGIRARLYHANVSITYKTLTDGLAPPQPLASMELPRGGEFLTSNPFLFAKKRKKARHTSLL